ncbi:hypothetical protein [Collimonas silvisoli]|uniref:hypothetical protein n=1 Tax=Collimonas silvisoli TaxID=2825884 RepID=UPI001B8B70C0|nr:hypothetical protein [Collimonas silvisoli]
MKSHEATLRLTCNDSVKAMRRNGNDKLSHSAFCQIADSRLRHIRLSTGRWRPARLFLFIAVLAVSALETACVILPQGETTRNTTFYSESRIFPLEEGKEVYRVQKCDIAGSPEYSSMASDCDAHGFISLVVRPKEWNLLKTLSATQGEPLKDEIRIQSRTFERPASASRNSNSHFLGSFEEDGFVWITPGNDADRPDQQSKSSNWYKTIAYRGEKRSRVPALVARDGSDIWVFVERSMPCDDDICFSVAETLGVDIASLPEKLRRKFMLFHVNTEKDWLLDRVFSAKLTRDLQQPIIPLPVSGNKFDLDFNVSPRVRFNSFQPQVKCERESVYSVWVMYPVMLPLDEKTSDNIKGCSYFKSRWLQTTQKEAFVPDSLEVPTGPDPTDPWKRPNN